MEYLVGVGVAVFLCAFAVLAGFDRDRAFYPTVLMAVAHYYILFAAMGSAMPALLAESVVAGVFIALSAWGFRKNLWVVAAALVGHGVFDSCHHLFIQNPGVPAWWSGFCMTFDILAGAFLALLLMKRSGYAHAVSRS